MPVLCRQQNAAKPLRMEPPLPPMPPIGVAPGEPDEQETEHA